MKHLISFQSPLVKGVFVKRHKRFFVDVRLGDGKIITAHCPNTGSMKTCFVESCDVYLSRSNDPKRKLAYTLEMTSPDGKNLVGVNTMMPNRVIGAWLDAGGFNESFAAKSIKREARFGDDTRFDFLLENEAGKKCFVEVKNTTFLVNDSIAFPDAVTERGQKHVDHLVLATKEQYEAFFIFFVNRTNGASFRPADEIDIIYAEKLRFAIDQGVKIKAFRAHLSLEGIGVAEEIPVVI